MKKLTTGILCAVMAVALLLSALLVHRVLVLKGDLSALETELQSSMEAWQATAAEKEALQADLSTLEESVREAELTLQESTDRAATLTGQVAGLETRNAELTAVRDELVRTQSDDSAAQQIASPQ